MTRSNGTPLPIVVRRRGAADECIHRGWAVLWENGAVRAHGDPQTQIFPRSCTKPFQALAFVMSGAADRFGCTDSELALACASHSGSPEHAEVAASMLRRAGLDGRALQCGDSEPYGDGERAEFLKQGGAPSPLIHNCSGKHSAFLLTQAHLGGAAKDYLHPDSPVQRLVRELVAELLELKPGQLGACLDGCSAPTFRMPIAALAAGFAKLANPEAAPPRFAAALTRIHDAVAAHPLLHSGRGRLCASILSATEGRAIPKNGADGVYAFGVRGRKIGFAIKVEDGHSRGHDLAVVDVLRRLGLLTSRDAEQVLAPFADATLRNAAGAAVGDQRLAIELV